MPTIGHSGVTAWEIATRFAVTTGFPERSRDCLGLDDFM
jgi:hypothetical protein